MDPFSEASPTEWKNLHVSNDRIEEHLRQLTWVADVVVRTRWLGQRSLPVAYVVGVDECGSERLAEAQRLLPRGLVAFLPRLPRTPEGAVDEAELDRSPVVGPTERAQWPQILRQALGPVEVGVVETAFVARGPSRLHSGLKPVSKAHGAAPQVRSGVSKRASLSSAPAFSSTPPSSDAWSDLSSLVELLERASARHPANGIWHLDASGGLSLQTYPELLREARQLAKGLAERGVTPGAKVLLVLPGRYYFSALWACWLARATAIPQAVPAQFDRTSPALDRLIHVWQDFDAPLVLTESSIRPKLNESLGGSAEVVDVTSLFDAPCSAHEVAPDDLILALSTSGSTGRPKAALHTQRTLLAATLGGIRQNAYGPEDIFLNWMPLDHVGSIVALHLSALGVGASQAHVPTEHILERPLRWLDMLHELRATVTWAPHFAFGLINAQDGLDQGQWNLAHLRVIINAGESIGSETAERFVQRLTHFGLTPAAMCPAWGMSETGSGMCFSRGLSSGSQAPVVALGFPIPGAAFRIVAEDGQRLDEGEIGLLEVSGGSVFVGYREEAATRECFTSDGWFRTGDLGFLEAGQLFITGRAKDEIVINGAKLAAQLIESAAESAAGVSPSFAAAFSVRLAESATDQLAVVLHTPRTGAARRQVLLDVLEEVRARCGVTPRFVVPVEQDMIPKTSIGKIQRAALSERFHAGELDALIRQADLLLENENTLPSWFLREEWTRTLAAPSPSAPGARVLLFTDEAETPDLIAADPRVAWVISVISGPEFAQIDATCFQIRPTEPADYQRLLEAVEARGHSPDCFIHLWARQLPSTDAAPDGAGTAPSSLLAFLQALGQARSRYESARSLVVSRGVHGVVPGDRVHPRQALVAGLLRSAAHELPWLSLRHVDVEVQDDGASAEPILAELGRCRALEQVAYRAGKRWTLGLAPLHQEDFAGPHPVVRGGAYVVSGGAGALGRELTRRLTKEHQARVLVLDRTELRLDERREPTPILYRGVDVTDRVAVANVIASIEEAWQLQFDGVFHLAGSFEETGLLELTPSALERSIASKVEGALALHDYFKTRPGSLFVSYSSTLACFGGPRTAAYVCANAVLNALSTYQRDECQLKAYSLCWSPWRNLGISADYSNESLLARHGYLLVDKENGWRSLLLALRCQASSLLIGMDRDHAAILRRTDPRHTVWRALARIDARDGLSWQSSLPVLTDSLGHNVVLELGAPAGENKAGASGGFGTARTPAQTEVERRLANVWRDLLGLDDIAIEDHFFNLGGDSISATRLTARIREQFACDISFAQLLAQPTLGELARIVARSETATKAAIDNEATHAPAGATYALTSSQARLWFLSQLEGGSVAYNMARAYSIDGPLEISTLERALGLLMARHEPLRTLYLDNDEGVRATVRDDLGVPVTRRSCDCDDAPALATALREATLAPFDFARGPAWRSVLLAGDQRSVLLLVLHHIISDGWSFNVLERELFDAYASLERGVAPRWAPLSGYGEHVAERAAATHDASVAYWERTLRDAPAGLDFPLDRERPLQPKFVGESFTFSIDEDLAKRLVLAVQDQKASLFVSLYAAFCSLIFKYTRQEDIVIGVPASGRDDSRSEALIGFFANTLPLRTRVEGAMPFNVLRQSVHRTLLEALPHQGAPLEQVVRALDRGGDLSRNPLYQVLFAFQSSPRTALQLPGRRVEEVGVPRHVATGDLTISIEPQATGALLGMVEYDSAIFDAASLESLVEQYVVLLERVSHSPELRVDEINLSRDSDLPALMTLGEGLRRPEAMKGSIDERVHAFAMAYPDAVAIVTAEESVCYAELDQLAARMAAEMRAAGVVAGGIVAITVNATVGSVAAMVGASKLGAVFLPLDPELPPARQEQLASDAGARAHVRADVDGSFNVEPRSINAARRPSPALLKNAAYVVYTSGSTGQPKGVVVGRAGLANSLACQIAELGITRTSRVMNPVPASSDGGLGQILMALWSGATLCYPSLDVVRSTRRMLDFLKVQRVTHTAFIPSYLDALPFAELPDLGVITLGGEAVSSRQLSRWRKGRRVVNAYGPSEATITATLMDCADLSRKPAIGRPLPNTRVYVVDPYGQPCPVGCPGELYIGGVGVALGYIDETSTEAERFSLDPFRNGEKVFRTGDKVRWLRDGNLEFLGRLDEQLKIRGFRVEPREIESHLQDATSVEDCAVVVHRASNEGPRLVAHIQPRGGCSIDAGDLKRFIATRLPKYMQPDHFQEIDRIPRTSSGKIDRAALRQRPLLHSSSGMPVAAATETERLLLELWEQRLESRPLSLTDNFFDMGGHSLLAMRLIADIEKQLGASITIADLFENPTPELMARRLDDKAAASSTRSLIPMRRRGSKPPIFLIHPAGGEVFCYSALARELAEGRPVYGLRDSGLAGAGLTAMAKSYAREILSAGHPAPYHIAGWSLGGVIGIEVARLLHQNGGRVFAILLDSHLPSLRPAHRTQDPALDADLDRYLASLAGLPTVPAEILALSAKQRHLALWSLIERAQDGNLGDLETVLATYQRNVAAACNFQAKPVTFPIALFSARDSRRSVRLKQRARWRWMARGRWIERSLPGSHHTLLQAPNVQGNARALAEYLEIWEGVSSSTTGSNSSVVPRPAASGSTT